MFKLNLFQIFWGVLWFLQSLKPFNAVQNDTNQFNSFRSDDSSFESKKSPFKIKTGEGK